MEGFLSDLSEVVSNGGHRVRAAVEAGDPAALHAVNALWAPFYWPTCCASYCQRHWTTDVAYADGHPG
ncbi:hypothetical protein [Rubrivirga sp. IMCC43871]|uniref:hypothetical protein n=1 Tax=Rubrivirga sp. IMCC43871 TaxID=3391575 RepID=UPI0039902DAF